jgi:signal transduction histidine kinase
MNKQASKIMKSSLRTKDNRKTWLSVSGFPTYDKDNNFYGFRGVCYDITKRKHYEIALEKSIDKIRKYQKKLKKLNTELTLVEEKERRRIAENLHDSLGQTLSLAYIKLSSIVNGDFSPHVQKVINETSDLLNNAISESRILTYDLSPPILYELGLVPAFKWKLEQITEKHGIKTSLLGENQTIGIKKEFNIFLYRIVVELINNALKHAQANLIELEIKKEKKFYYISVRDNGVGFNRNAKKKTQLSGGFGLNEYNRAS